MECSPSPFALAISSAVLLLAPSLGCQTSSQNAPASEPPHAESAPTPVPTEAPHAGAEEGDQNTAPHCAQSPDCTNSGRCGVNDEGQCAATRVEHCQQSQGCTESARCSLNPRGTGCIAASDADCARSELCRTEGQCAFSEALGCQPSTAAHCQASEACKTQGRCALKEAPREQESERNQPPVCFSPAHEAIELTRYHLWDAYEAASLIPLRPALQRVEQGDAQLETHRFMPQISGPDAPPPPHLRWHIRATISETADPDTRARFYVPCDGYLALNRTILPPIQWRREGFVLQAQAHRLLAGDQVLLDTSSDLCDAAILTWSTTSLIAWVGPVITLRQYEEFTEGEYDGVLKSWRTFDLRSGRPAALTALVEEDSLVEAFKNDPWVQEHIASFLQNTERRHEQGRIPASELDEARRWIAHFKAEDSLTRLLTLFNERLRGSAFVRLYPDRVPYSFAAFDEARGLAAMRIAIKRLAGAGLTDVITLGLWVKPRQEYLDAFKRAAAEGWLQGGAHSPVHLERLGEGPE